MGNRKVDKELIDGIRETVMCIRHCVDHPEDVKVNISQSTYRIVVELYTNPKDVGQVMGRDGHIKSSLRSLLAAMSGKYHVKVNLDYITESDNRSSAYIG